MAKRAKSTRKAGSIKRGRGATPVHPDPKVRMKKVGDKVYDLSSYQKAKTAAGNTSLDNGDALAKKLRGVDLDDVYKRAAKALGEPEKNLRSRYRHLNPGMQRMNLGNRMRAAV